MSAPPFIETNFTSRSEYDLWVAAGADPAKTVATKAVATTAPTAKPVNKARAMSFIDSKFTSRSEYEKWATTPTVIIRGMAISHNVIPSVLLAKDTGCGDFEVMDLMKGEHMKPDMLKIKYA